MSCRFTDPYVYPSCQTINNNQLSPKRWSAWAPYINCYELKVKGLSHIGAADSVRSSSLEPVLKTSRFALSVIQKIKDKPSYEDFNKVQNLKPYEMTFFESETKGEQKKGFITGTHLAVIQNDKIGEGQFKIVYEGKNLFTEKKFALVRLKLKNGQIPQNVKRGIKIMAKLKHIEGVVQLVGCFKENQNIYYMVQEFCEEGDLLGHLGKLSTASKKDISLQLLNLIKNIHDAGYIYGDLKRENILLKKDSLSNRLTVHLSDFDTSHKMIKESKGGSLEFMAPERIRWHLTEWGILSNTSQQTIDLVQCEIYELGLVLLELFVSDGKIEIYPWVDQTLLSIHTEDDFVRFVGEVQKCLDSLLKKNKDPSLAKIYGIIAAMLNASEPQLRPSLEEVINVFENGNLERDLGCHEKDLANRK